MWTRKLTVIGGQTAPNDWAILRNRQVVGRVYMGALQHGELHWHWSTSVYPSDWGRTKTMEEALDRLRAAIRARWPDSVARLPVG